MAGHKDFMTMTHLHNTTFVCAAPDLERMVHILRTEVIPALRGDAESITMARVGSSGADAESVSVQFGFASEKAMNQWVHTRLTPVLTSLAGRHGERILPFSTVLEVIDHEL